MLKYPNAYMPHVTRDDTADYVYYDKRRLGGPLSICTLVGPAGAWVNADGQCVAEHEFRAFPVPVTHPQPEDYE